MNRRLLLILPMVALLAYPAGAAASKSKKQRKHSSAAKARAKNTIRWTSYRNDLLGVQLRVPAAWKVKRTDQAVAFTSLTGGNNRVAFGVMKSQEALSLEETAQQFLMQEMNSGEWHCSKARLARYRAVKISGFSSENPERRVVHYFVEGPQGIYLVQCMGNRRLWSAYEPLFSSILNQFQFI